MIIQRLDLQGKQGKPLIQKIMELKDIKPTKIEDVAVKAICPCTAEIRLNEENFDSTEFLQDGYYEIEISFTCASCGKRTDIFIPK